ncbi:MAG: hypothetical protein AB1631_31665 [Acidobacteriota bacterium]
MIESDSGKFAEIIGILAESFGERISDGRIEAYFRALSDMSIDQIELAAIWALRSCRFFPRPVEIREMVEGSAEDQASGAWEIALEAYRKAGYWQSVVFEDGAIGAAILTVFGGWTMFCDGMRPPVFEKILSEPDEEGGQRVVGQRQIGGLSDEMVASRRKEFLVSYRNARRTGRAQNYLPGYHEIENRNTIATWTRGQFPTEQYIQRVLIVGEKGARWVEAKFDRWTARLITTVAELFEQKPVTHLPAGKPRLMLPEATAEESAPETVQAGMKALARREWPKVGEGMTDQEFEARREELREQARQIETEQVSQ